MANFEVYGKFEIKKEGVPVNQIAQLLKTNLSKHYDEENITITPTGITLKGNLNSTFNCVVAKADTTIKIEGNQLTYRVDGNSYLAKRVWVFIVLSFFPGFGSYHWSLLLILLCFVDYNTNRNRPKRYFEEAFKSVQFEVG